MSIRSNSARAGLPLRDPPGTFRIAAVQMASGPKVDANLREAERLVGVAAQAGAKLVVMPEYFAIMGMKDADKVAVREPFGRGDIQSFMARVARKFRVWIAGAGIPLDCGRADKVRNTCLLYDDRGELAARYDKIHLFGLEMGEDRFNEERTIEPGDQVVVADTPFGRLGLSICYDLRFPELYRAMGNVDIILVPSAFTETTGRAHWETLLRARAIENLAYVLAPAQGGYHVNGRETHGDSMVVDPWGVVLDRLQRGSGVVVASVDPAYRAKLRASLPALEHRTLRQV